MNVNAAASPGISKPWVGQSIPRVEDPSLLTGRGRLHRRSRHPSREHCTPPSSARHTRMRKLSRSIPRRPKRARGVAAVLTGDDIKALTASLVVGVKAPVECWPIAIGRVRYVGEPVVIVVAETRYLAEDAIDLIDAQYEALPAAIDPLQAIEAGAALLHDGFPNNVANDRRFRYGDPERAFADAPHTVSVTIRYPRNSCTPIEPMASSPNMKPGDQSFDVLANFQGPFSIHAVIVTRAESPGQSAAAAGRRLIPAAASASSRAFFPYIVLIAAAARATGRPVKWIEDRLEHLTASVSATNRATTLRAAVTDQGKILALGLGPGRGLRCAFCARRSPPRFIACTAI